MYSQEQIDQVRASLNLDNSVFDNEPEVDLSYCRTISDSVLYWFATRDAKIHTLSLFDAFVDSESDENAIATALKFLLDVNPPTIIKCEGILKEYIQTNYPDITIIDRW